MTLVFSGDTGSHVYHLFLNMIVRVTKSYAIVRVGERDAWVSKSPSQSARENGREGNVPLLLRLAVVADVRDVARIWREGWLDAHLGHVSPPRARNLGKPSVEL